MTGYRKILTAIDQSPRSAEVFDQAATLAQLQDAELKLLHCLTLPRSNQDFGDRYSANLTQFMQLAQQQLDTGMEETRKWMEGFAQQAQMRGIKVDWDWRMGAPGAEICATAKAWEADLIVVGRRGHQGFKEIVLGSVSNYVLHRAPCSVMVVQGKSET